MRRITAGCVLLASITWFGAFHVDRLHELDARVLELLNRLYGNVVEDVFDVFSAPIDLPFYAIVCAVIVCLGVRTAGARAALIAGIALAGANVTTQLLKRALAEPRPSDLLEHQLDAASWPSGHATAATIVMLTALMLASARLRPGVLVLGGIWTAIVCIGIVISHWHYPSDVLGGVLVAGAWGSAAAGISASRPARAATAAPRRRWQRATG